MKLEKEFIQCIQKYALIKTKQYIGGDWYNNEIIDTFADMRGFLNVSANGILNTLSENINRNWKAKQY
jgi:hypothetical protein